MKNEPHKPNKFGGLIPCGFFLLQGSLFHYGSNLVAVRRGAGGPENSRSPNLSPVCVLTTHKLKPHPFSYAISYPICDIRNIPV